MAMPPHLDAKHVTWTNTESCAGNWELQHLWKPQLKGWLPLPTDQTQTELCHHLCKIVWLHLIPSWGSVSWVLLNFCQHIWLPSWDRKCSIAKHPRKIAELCSVAVMTASIANKVKRNKFWEMKKKIYRHTENKRSKSNLLPRSLKHKSLVNFSCWYCCCFILDIPPKTKKEASHIGLGYRRKFTQLPLKIDSKCLRCEQVMQAKISLNTVNRVQINMNLKREKRGMSPGIFLSILPRWYGRVISTLMNTIMSNTKGNFPQVLPRAKKYYIGSKIRGIKVVRK